ncbi:Rha family transcriptional regulator [Mucispirillum schaedleri]|uniref:Rha family transcriptional regulator n=1 Tax=Mucispirillum schaedleri TaxID=248039 RepID=UPI001F599342|nr:Rha family transcriptional regulator [Mucispirillum schaedleri]
MSNLTEKHKIIPVIMKSSNGELIVSSRDIAAGIGKEHYDVIKKIRNVLGEGEFSVSNYLSEQGKIMPEYLLPKDSFILLLMNYQGYNDFKRAYIKRFNEMENALKEQYVHQAEITPDIVVERAKIMERLSDHYRDKCDGRYSQILDSYITKELYGEHILPLPERIEHYYTAEEAGKILGISANKVGELATALFP